MEAVGAVGVAAHFDAQRVRDALLQQDERKGVHERGLARVVGAEEHLGVEPAVPDEILDVLPAGGIGAADVLRGADVHDRAAGVRVAPQLVEHELILPGVAGMIGVGPVAALHLKVENAVQHLLAVLLQAGRVAEEQPRDHVVAQRLVHDDGHGDLLLLRVPVGAGDDGRVLQRQQRLVIGDRKRGAFA